MPAIVKKPVVRANVEYSFSPARLQVFKYKFLRNLSCTFLSVWAPAMRLPSGRGMLCHQKRPLGLWIRLS